ncbi:MAG: LLM class flavin-dependent oxidoreductase [Cyanobacteria bacterium P01_G01_bin.39]
MEFSLLYFSGDGSTRETNKYNLLLETVKYGDIHDFSAVWTPERHFHPFGGLYPNPSVIAAALATITDNIQLRSGSVVMPLQNPVRVAEEWAVVDNLSQGRVGLSFASGWHADDFLLQPANYSSRKEAMWSGIKVFKQLWQGEQVEFLGGTGQPVKIQTFPRPLQAKAPPIWITCGADETFIGAGKIGANVLTSMLYETTDNLARRINLYRTSLTQNGYDPQQGKVSLMLHTFIGNDQESVRSQVKEPFCNYIKTHFGLAEKLAQKIDFPVDPSTFTEDDRASLFDFAFERYLSGRVMIGTRESCRQTIEQMEKIGVDEIACLIDFGLDPTLVMNSLDKLKDLKEEYQNKPIVGQYSALSFF